MKPVGSVRSVGKALGEEGGGTGVADARVYSSWLMVHKLVTYIYLDVFLTVHHSVNLFPLAT